MPLCAALLPLHQSEKAHLLLQEGEQPPSGFTASINALFQIPKQASNRTKGRRESGSDTPLMDDVSPGGGLILGGSREISGTTFATLACLC